MKILINVATLRTGGGLQVGINLVKYCLQYRDNDIEFFFLINKNFKSYIINNTNEFYIVNDYPSNILNFKNKLAIKKYINNVKPDLIYSVGSPSYLGIKEEVIRLTNPWIIYNNQIAYKKISLKEQLKLKISIYIKKQFLRNCKYVITQTNDAKNNIITNLNKKKDNVYVISNVYSFNLEKYKIELFERDYTQNINLLVFSANYFHKNIDICIKIAKELKNKSINNIRFILTIPFEEYNDYAEKIKLYAVDNYFINKGKINLEDIPALYKESHILFLPTLLEVFSVTFLEAMIFKLPIITSNLSFNKEVCKDAAYYFNDYFEGRDVINLILNLIENEEERNLLIENGNNIVSLYKSNNEIYKEHIDTLKNIYAK